LDLEQLLHLSRALPDCAETRKKKNPAAKTENYLGPLRISAFASRPGRAICGAKTYTVRKATNHVKDTALEAILARSRCRSPDLEKGKGVGLQDAQQPSRRRTRRLVIQACIDAGNLLKIIDGLGGCNPCTCLVAIWHISPKGQFAFAQIPTGDHIWHAGCNGNGPISLVFSLGVVGRDTVSTAAPLVPVIYNL
jgi:hypothetical protein